MTISSDAAHHPPAPASERRRLTVLFTDLSGSTPLGRRMETEQYAALLARVRAVWHDVTRRFNGLVLRTQGDGATIVFGYPHESELDTVHAVKAALAIHQGVSALGVEGGGFLSAHSGIHAGVVLLIDGDLERGRFDLVGDVANTTSKLERAAGPGELLVTRNSLGANAGMFLLEDTERDLFDDLGVGKVVRILGLSSVSRRFDATAQRGLTPLVARDDVLRLLRSFLAARDPEQRCALVTAPAGLGKTRLLEELSRLPEMQAFTKLGGSCETSLTSAALQPFVQMFEAYLASDAIVARDLAAQALGSRNPDVCRDFFAALSARSSVLLVIDDWQWSDDASRRLLQALLEMRDGPRLLVTARPQDDGTPWIPGAVQSTLRPFAENETPIAVRRWLPDADPFLISKIHGYAGGVPLVVEELCHLASANALSQTLEGHGGTRHTWLASIVASRLQRLPPEQALIVRAASVVGIEIPRWLLDVACAKSLSDEQLGPLANADFIYPDPRHGTLRFKHGITRDAVYETVGLYERRELHGRIRAALLPREGEADRPERLESLAHHCWGSGHWADAARYGERAGDRSTETFAMDRARAQYRMAMAAIDRMATRSREHALSWCRLAGKLGMASIFDPLALNNDSAPFEKAIELARDHGDARAEARALYWLGYILYGFGRYREARDHARAALAMSRDLGDHRLTAQIEATLGQILAAACEYDEAIRYIDVAIDAKRRHAGAGGGIAIGASYALSCKGSVLADQGDFARAHECFDEALHLLGGTTHPVANSVRNWITVALVWQGRWQEARRVALESVRIAENTRALLLLAVSRSIQGFAHWCQDGDATALRTMSDAAGWMAARHGQMFTSLHFGWLAEAHVAEGRAERARSLAAHVLRRARHGERLGEGNVCRALALAALRENDPASATRWMRRADQSALARDSARERALNELAMGHLLDAQGAHSAARAATERAREALDRLRIQLPAWLASGIG